MGFCSSLNKFVITPPKTGTHSVNHLMAVQYRSLELSGHIGCYEAGARLHELGVNPDHVQWAMSVRQPVSRLMSSINHWIRCFPETSLNEAMQAALQNKGIVFTTQSSYWSPSWQIRLFPFDGMPILDWLGCDPKDIPHKNLGNPRMTPEEVVNHKMFGEVMARYEDDALLHIQAVNDFRMNFNELSQRECYS